MNAPQAPDNNDQPDFREMTAQSIGLDLLQALVAEIKLMPDVWVKLSQAKQDDIIDRLRARVEHNVKMAVHLLAADGRTVVVGDLDQITIKGGVKAVVKIGAGAANQHELFEAVGLSVLLVVANPKDHTGGMGDVKGEGDQRGLDLGHEYHANDGGGMPEGGAGGDVIEGEVKLLTNDSTPTDEELQEYYELGYQGAGHGIAESECPAVRPELVAQWIRGFKAFAEDQEWAKVSRDGDDSHDDLFIDAVAFVQEKQEAVLSHLMRELGVGHLRAEFILSQMATAGVVSEPDSNGVRTVLISGEE